MRLTASLIAFSLAHVGIGDVSVIQIELHGQPTTLSSTSSENTVASMAIDGYNSTCAVANANLPYSSWWSVDMGAEITVHTIKITNKLMWTLCIANLMYTVDDKLCGFKHDYDYDSLTITCDKPVTGRVLKIERENGCAELLLAGTFSLCDVAVWGVKTAPQEKVDDIPQINLFGLRAAQESTWSEDTMANAAIDGRTDTCTETNDYVSKQPWWKIDLGANTTIHSFKITNRQFYESRLGNVEVTVDGHPCGSKYLNGDAYYLWVTCEKPVTGRVLKIQLMDAPVRGILTLCEVEVWGYVHGKRFLADPVPKVDLIGLMSEQSSTYDDDGKYASSVAIDGNTGSCTWTKEDLTDQPWWSVTMGREITVHSVKITNHRFFMSHLANVVITVDGNQCGPKYVYADINHLWVTCPEPVTGKVLKIQLEDAPVQGILTMCEVEVWGF